MTHRTRTIIRYLVAILGPIAALVALCLIDLPASGCAPQPEATSPHDRDPAHRDLGGQLDVKD